MNTPSALTLLVFVPWIGAGLAAVLPARHSRVVSLGLSLSTLVLGLSLLAVWPGSAPAAGLTLEEKIAWLPALRISYHLGVDGLSLLLVLLTGVIGPMSLLASWSLERGGRLFRALLLLAQGSALGVFVAQDFFLWFLFWELSLVPVYFLIKLWGGPGAERAAYQFVIYTVGGSAFLLLGFAAIYAAAGTMDFAELRLLANGTLTDKFGPAGATLVFLGVFLGFAVKVPLYPFHTWLPPAYAEAPTGVAMFLTAVMAKMGVYGFLRVLWPLFPDQLQAASGVLLWLALAGAVGGALAAVAQTDLKRMLAYASLTHVSYCLLALFAVTGFAGLRGERALAAGVAALDGAMLQMFNHGLAAAALFFLAGVLEARAGGRRTLADFGGVRAASPVLAGLCGVAVFSSLGLPGLNGFVSEFLIFRGVFGLAPGTAAAGCLALLVTAVFLLTFYQRVFHGPPTPATATFRDLSGREVATVAVTVVLMFVVGVYPQPLVSLVNGLASLWAAPLGLPFVPVS